MPLTFAKWGMNQIPVKSNLTVHSKEELLQTLTEIREKIAESPISDMGEGQIIYIKSDNKVLSMSKLKTFEY